MIWAVMWYWVLYIFTVADIITTKIGLRFGLTEGNPIMAPFIDQIIEMKIAVLLFAVLAILIIERLSKGNGWIPVSIGACATCAAVVNNVAKFL